MKHLHGLHPTYSILGKDSSCNPAAALLAGKGLSRAANGATLNTGALQVEPLHSLRWFVQNGGKRGERQFCVN